MVFYLDIIFLENWGMNYIILIATFLISSKKVDFTKIGMASFIGSIYTILEYMIKVNGFINVIFKIIVSIIMIIVAFKCKNIKTILKKLLLFYMVSLVFGGTAFMLIFIINPNEVIIKSGRIVEGYSFGLAILGSSIAFSLIAIVSNIIQKFECQICKLIIFYKEKNIKINSFIDSGNLLKDPVSGEDVIIVEENALKELLPYNLFEYLKNVDKGKFLTDGNVEGCFNVKFIPFSSLGNENGILIGFKPDYIYIEYEGEIKKICNVVIGFYSGKLTKTNLYTSLIGLNILRGSEDYGKFISNT